MSAEVAVRAAVIEALRSDAALMAAVHAVHDGEPARAAAPHAHVGECLGADWGGKDVAGCELRLTIGLTVADETPARLAAMIARVDPALGAAGVCARDGGSSARGCCDRASRAPAEARARGGAR